jgi:hypothetical protein
MKDGRPRPSFRACLGQGESRSGIVLPGSFEQSIKC